MSRKGSQSTTQQTSNTSYADQSVNVAEGGLAAAAGSTVHVESLSDDVALGSLAAQQNTAAAALAANRDVSAAALNTTQNVAAGAFDTAARALTSNRDVAEIAISANSDINQRSLDTTSRLAETAINTVTSLGEVASRERIDTLESANLAIRSSQGAADKFADLAAASLERSQTPDSAVTKQLIWVVGGGIGLLALAFMFRSRK